MAVHALEHRRAKNLSFAKRRTGLALLMAMQVVFISLTAPVLALADAKTDTTEAKLAQIISSLKPGTTLRLQINSRICEGRYLRGYRDTLLLRTAGYDSVYLFNEVHALSIRGKELERGAKVGGLVGFGVGVLVGSAFVSLIGSLPCFEPSTSRCDKPASTWEYVRAATIFGGFGAVLGAPIGGSLSPPECHQIYPSE